MPDLETEAEEYALAHYGGFFYETVAPYQGTVLGRI
jgi:hypothetical protein